MNDEWNYIPVFKNTVISMQELSDDELGKVLRALVADVERKERPSGFSDMLYIMYKIMADDANRVYDLRKKKIAERTKRSKDKKKSSATQNRSFPGDEIDPEEALRLALERSFGDDGEG